MFISFIGNAFTKEVKVLLFIFLTRCSDQVGHDILCNVFPRWLERIHFYIFLEQDALTGFHFRISEYNEVKKDDAFILMIQDVKMYILHAAIFFSIQTLSYHST